MQVNTTPTTPWYRQRWPWFLMAGPFIVVLAGSYTFWLAASRPDALVVGDYYRQGKAINQDLRRDVAAKALGLHMALAYDPAAGRLKGNIGGKVAGKVSVATIRLRLVHSTRPEKDLSLLATPDSNGDFSLPLPLLEMARWQVIAEDARGDWRLSGSWLWPQQRSMTLAADA